MILFIGLCFFLFAWSFIAFAAILGGCIQGVRINRIIKAKSDQIREKEHNQRRVMGLYDLHRGESPPSAEM